VKNGRGGMPLAGAPKFWMAATMGTLVPSGYVAPSRNPTFTSFAVDRRLDSSCSACCMRSPPEMLATEATQCERIGDRRRARTVDHGSELGGGLPERRAVLGLREPLRGARRNVHLGRHRDATLGCAIDASDQ